MLEVTVKLKGEEAELAEALIWLQENQVQIESKEGLGGWLAQSLSLSNQLYGRTEDGLDKDLLVACLLSDPQSIKLYEQWFSHLQRLQKDLLNESLKSENEELN